MDRYRLAIAGEVAVLFCWQKGIRKMPEEMIVRGTPEEREIYWEAKRHYDMSRQDLDVRIPDWNRKDELFRSFIDETNWPYSAQVFDPRVFTSIFEKSARLLANKPKGRMIPREGGDALGARVVSELLSFQWDDAERIDGTPILAKWALMDMNARKYGASFALCKWHFEKNKDGKIWFDGPSFQPWNNRDVLHNPSYSSIRKWIQLREYVTLDDLSNINDVARGKPIYKNLDILRDAVSKEARSGGDTRSSNWASRNLSIKGLTDFLGMDEVFKTVEVVTEYRPDRWITFSPKHGVVIRDIDNPYKHGQIPVVMLKYYPIDEDIYGLSEIEPIEKLQRATNALICQYLDSINMSLYKPIKVRSAAVQLHTLEFGPGKKWLMNDPQSDVLPYETSPTGVAEFTSTYRFLVGAMQEALGESSAAVSQLVPGQGERTATEIKELSVQRNVRDNYNQLFLSEAIKDQMELWYQMDQQFMFDNREKQRVIRIVGREALDFFEQMGMGGEGLTDDAIEQLASPEMEEMVLDPTFDMRQFLQPLFPVQTPDGSVPKFRMDEVGETGSVILEPNDLSGYYDYIPEIRSAELPDPTNVQVLQQMVAFAQNPATIQVLAGENQKLKLSKLMQDLFEVLGLKDSFKYFEKIGGAQLEQNQALGAGTGGPGQGNPITGTQGQPGMEGSPQAVFGGQA